MSTLLRQIIGVIFAIRAAVLSLAAAAVLLSAACGLPTIPFLEPPERDVPDAAEEIRFSHRVVDEGLRDVFRGYELYYKFYGDIIENGTLQEDIEDQFLADENFILDSPRQPNPRRLTQRGYRRIRRPEDPDRRPVVRVPREDRGSELTITLRFPDQEQDDALYFIDDGDPVFLRRAVDDDDDTPKAFFPIGPQDDNGVYDADDADFSQRLLERLEDDRIEIAVFGLAYGVTEDFEVIYSEPAFLGRVELRN